VGKGKVITLIAAGLVAGLVLGSFGLASAVPANDPATGECLGTGARMGLAMRDAGARMADVLADLTGLSVDDIRDRRADGESVADIAESENVSSEAVVDAALAARKEILDAKVADGSITPEQADAMLAQMTERLTERVESTEQGGWGRGGGRGMGAGACGGQGGAGGRGAGGGAGACGGVCPQVPATE
jgi:hypothetical protein